MYNDAPIIIKTYKFYILLYVCTNIFPKKDRFTIGQKCENTTLELLELLFVANTKSDSRKTPFLLDIDVKLKILQTLIRICHDVQAIDQRKYLILQEALEEIGRMLGGWIKSLSSDKKKFEEKETPAQ
jgi:hypothetical protein